MLVQQLWRTRKTGEDMPNEQKEAKGDAKEQRDAHSCKGQKEMKLEKKHQYWTLDINLGTKDWN